MSDKVQFSFVNPNGSHAKVSVDKGTTLSEFLKEKHIHPSSVTTRIRSEKEDVPFTPENPDDYVMCQNDYLVVVPSRVEGA